MQEKKSDFSVVALCEAGFYQLYHDAPLHEIKQNLWNLEPEKAQQKLDETIDELIQLRKRANEIQNEM